MRVNWRKEWTAPAVGAVSFAAGATAGYFYCQRKLSFEVEETVTAVLERTEDLEIEWTDPAQEYKEVLDGFIRALKDLNITPHKVPKSGSPNPDVTTELVEENIMTPASPDNKENLRRIPESAQLAIVDSGWDYAKEQEDRTPDSPYVIHRDEFFNEETGFRQTSLTWYEGDKILADETDVPVYAPEKVVGVLRFGHGSGDKDVVYIRNEKLAAEYEVTRHEGSFQTEVLGIQAEEEAEADDLKHSQAIRRFRMD